MYYGSTYHPNIGGQVIVPADIHTKKIIVNANFLDLLLLEYVKGLVTARYLTNGKNHYTVQFFMLSRVFIGKL